MTMPDVPRVSGEAFAVERLRENPDLDFAALREAAAEHGIVIQPIQYGRARKQLGLTKPGAAPAAAPAAKADRQHDGADEPEPTDAPAPKPSTSRAPSPTFDWIVSALREEPTLSYGELKARADEEDRKIAPIMYGRAKALLGLVPVRERGTGAKRTRSTKAKPEAAPRALAQVESVAADRFGKQLKQAQNIDDLVRIVQQLDDERRRLRDLLVRIADSIDDALGLADD